MEDRFEIWEVFSHQDIEIKLQVSFSFPNQETVAYKNDLISNEQLWLWFLISFDGKYKWEGGEARKMGSLECMTTGTRASSTSRNYLNQTDKAQKYKMFNCVSAHI